MPAGVYDKTGAKNPKWRGGKSLHPLYWVYHAMIQRCRNPRQQRYADYGGRGIKVCQRWLDDFWSFVEDMGPRPEGFSLDRVDNDGDYEPGNVRWSDAFASAKNRRPCPPRARTAEGRYA